MKARIYLDTNIFVDAFERAVPEPSPVWHVLDAIEAQEFDAVTSELTLAELLPKLIAAGDTGLMSVYMNLFSDGRVFEAFKVTREILEEAAHLRAMRMSLKLPDAIHMATAVTAGCFVMFSNDGRIDPRGALPVVGIRPDALDVIRDLAR